MSTNDGKWKLRDGHDWQTLIVVRDNLVEQVDGPWRAELEGRTLESIQAFAAEHKIQVERVE